jgi:2-keto-4-pentenoate hydratase
MMGANLVAFADQLVAAFDTATTLPSITARAPDFSVADAYDVLAEIERRRRAQGWQAVGRKIGFTNRTIWSRYGVWQPIWASIWAHTVHFAPGSEATLPLGSFLQPRIEPEVVFKLKTSVPSTDDPSSVLESVEWMAPGFEVVQCPFPDWKFSAADCAAACGLHGALVVGAPVAVTDANRAALAAVLTTFTLILSRGDNVIDRGTGANVLGGPPLALAHLARLLTALPQFPQLSAGEIITTGTVTDAWPVAAGEVWSSDYGSLGLNGLRVRFEGAERPRGSLCSL